MMQKLDETFSLKKKNKTYFYRFFTFIIFIAESLYNTLKSKTLTKQTLMKLKLKYIN